ncbi:hypothetical protein [Nocardia farcinica]|uniref:hypothetical protein n=1 Tax=Nocardia farcinica TaxID=37329 RepID=UPI0007A43C9B|nr:hypothetical protein [Nocardia farcinica]AXK86680.1 hypothetical protein DXT66_14535 [Nocardia farcinica]MBF6138813.1 hypothetical protein [Nocardia farcinica]MBF6523157.1 hypothetical protein [Nocardia farcinica]MCZ9328657.1 hypothetical protein [Nocardia farcinica]
MPYSPSPALQRWRTDRAAALGSLVAVHAKVVDGRRGRQYATERLNQALFIALASEFQGYCRDLHDIAVLAATDGLASSGDPRLVWARSALIRNRKLSTGNASPGALGNDFKFFGMDFWPSVQAMYPAKTSDWVKFLTKMNDTRNAIAHRDDTKLAAVTDPLTLRTFKRWRATLNSLASGIDRVVEAYLQDTIGKSW